MKQFGLIVSSHSAWKALSKHLTVTILIYFLSLNMIHTTTKVDFVNSTTQFLMGEWVEKRVREKKIYK